MSRPRKVTNAGATQRLHEHIAANAVHVVETLNDIGIWHVSPCTDVGFKHTLADNNRAARFITSFSELLDTSSDPSCRMLDGKKILENRSVESIERIPESIGYTGEVIRGKKKPNEKDKGSPLPEHPKIDSGFVVGLFGGEVYKMGIEMQVRDEGNMPARGVDYGSRIFRYAGGNGTEGSVRKVFEFLLSRWGIKNNDNKLISISGKDGAECDKDVSGGLVNSICLCCVSIFLGESINILTQILDFLKGRYPEKFDGFNDDDKQTIGNFISGQMRTERNILSRQVVAFTERRENVDDVTYEGLSDKSKELVDRLGFFKYGHLMSQQDVDALGDEDLKNDYQCIKIQKGNVMENIDQVSAIWGTVNPNYAIELEKARGELEKAQGTIRSQEERIAHLERQLQSQKRATPDRKLAGRRPEPARQRGKGNPSPRKGKVGTSSESSGSDDESFKKGNTDSAKTQRVRQQESKMSGSDFDFETSEESE